MNISKLINIFLRGSTLLSRVILFLFIAKYLEPNQVGLFGLVLASIYLSVYAVGLEFYVYSTRELLRYNKSNIALLFVTWLVVGAFYTLKVLSWTDGFGYLRMFSDLK